MKKLELCPFCAGDAHFSFRQAKFYGRFYSGDVKISYYVQVICNKCHARGKPILTRPLTNPRPRSSQWAQQIYFSEHVYPRPNANQTEMFRGYVEKAAAAWNTRKE